MRNSYLFVSVIGELALEDRDYDLAEKWEVIGLQYKGIHGLLGKQEFFWGQVHFAKGEMEKAREYFVKVRKNSGWRLFRNENPEYRKLVEEKKVRPTMLEVQATASCLQYPASAKIMPVTHPANFSASLQSAIFA